MAPGSNPLEKMGSTDDLAAEMRTVALALDNHMLYTIFSDALPAEYEVEARNLVSRDSIGCEEIIKAVRERHHRLSRNRKEGSISGHALYVGDGAGGGLGKDGGRCNGKGVRWGKHGRSGRGTNEVGGGSATAAVGDGSTAEAAEGSAQMRGSYRCGKQGHIRANCTEKLCSRCNDTVDVCPMSKEEAALAVTGEIGARDDDGEDGTVQGSAFKAEETGEYRDAIFTEWGMGSWPGR